MKTINTYRKIYKRTKFLHPKNHPSPTKIRKVFFNISSFCQLRRNPFYEKPDKCSETQFNKLTKDLQQTIQVLQLPSISRTQQKIQEIEQQFKDLKYFQQIEQEGKDKMLQKCCKLFSYQFYKPGRTVLHLGDLQYYFYLILDGEVSVQFATFDKNKKQLNSIEELKRIDQQTNIKKRIKNKIYKISTGAQKNIEQQLILRKLKKLLKDINSNTFELKHKFFLKTGETFGGQALLSNHPRQASIVTKTPCHFAVLWKYHFDQIIRRFENKKRNQYLDFLTQLPLFEEMRKHKILEIYMNCIKLKYKRGHIIYEENQETKNFYIIKSGNLTFWKNVKIKKQQSLQRNIIAQLTKNITKAQTTQIKNQRIFLLSARQFFGAKEILLQKAREYTVKCDSDSEILEFNLKYFKKEIYKNEMSRLFISNIINQRQQLHLQLTNNFQRLTTQKKNYMIQTLFDKYPQKTTTQKIISQNSLTHRLQNQQFQQKFDKDLTLNEPGKSIRGQTQSNKKYYRKRNYIKTKTSSSTNKSERNDYKNAYFTQNNAQYIKPSQCNSQYSINKSITNYLKQKIKSYASPNNLETIKVYKKKYHRKYLKQKFNIPIQKIVKFQDYIEKLKKIKSLKNFKEQNIRRKEAHFLKTYLRSSKFAKCDKFLHGLSSSKIQFIKNNIMTAKKTVDDLKRLNSIAFKVNKDNLKTIKSKYYLGKLQRTPVKSDQKRSKSCQVDKHLIHREMRHLRYCYNHSAAKTDRVQLKISGVNQRAVRKLRFNSLRNSILIMQAGIKL